MIKTLVAVDGKLACGALAFVLASQPDIHVVAQHDTAEGLVDLIDELRPDVSVVDLALIRPDDLASACAAHERLGRCRVLVLVDPRRAAQLTDRITRHAPVVAFISKNADPARVLASLRTLADGAPVIDPDLVEAALTRGTTPLTARESEILEVAANGGSVREIASKLTLSPGTIRNHLSRILAKLDARTRVDAVRIARESGWI